LLAIESSCRKAAYTASDHDEVIIFARVLPLPVGHVLQVMVAQRMQDAE